MTPAGLITSTDVITPKAIEGPKPLPPAQPEFLPLVQGAKALLDARDPAGPGFVRGAFELAVVGNRGAGGELPGVQSAAGVLAARTAMLKASAGGAVQP